mgnify:CR=1 FL=1
MRRDDGKRDTLAGNDLEALAVDRGLRQPETDRITTKPAAKIANAPPHLGCLVATTGEGEDDVVIWHRERVAMAGAARRSRDRPE